MKKIALALSLIFLFSSSLFAQWQADVRLTYNAPAFSYTTNNSAWSIAADGLILHVVWYDGRDGNSEIYYKRSSNAGATWGSDTRLSFDNSVSEYPSVTFYDRYVHVVWETSDNGNYAIYYKRSDDKGLTWPVFASMLTNGLAGTHQPSIAKSGSTVHLVWYDSRDGNDEIYYLRSTNNGASWGSQTRLTNNSRGSVFPSVAVNGSTVHVVWEQQVTGYYDQIYYKRSTDGGTTWGPDISLGINSLSYGTSLPCISVSGSYVHVVWNDGRDSYNANTTIYYKRSTNGGVSWSADTRLPSVLYNAANASIASSGSNVHVVWRDYRDGNYELYYKRSSDRGASWLPDIRLTSNSAFSEDPSIAVSGSRVHVVWNDNRDDNNYEVFYKQNPTGNPFLIFRPANFTVRSYLTGTIDLTWADSSDNEDGFKIERSTDAGKNWILKDSVSRNMTNYKDTNVSAGTVYYYRVYAYNQWDISDYSDIAYDTVLSPIGIINYNEGIPEKFSLGNYPNPFNPTTKIKFSIPGGFPDNGLQPLVQIKLYDILGKEIAALVNENLKPGNYEVEWDAANYPSGIYFCKLTVNPSDRSKRSDGYEETKKMLLIK